jgi:hypothetical protein
MVMSRKLGGRGRGPSGRGGIAQPQAQARLAVNLPVALHRKLKIRAAQRGVSIRDYIMMLLEKDGIG